MIKREKRIFPFPEVLTPEESVKDKTKKWTISETPFRSPSCISFRQKEATVPLNSSEYDAFIRAHEMCHALSPIDIPAAETEEIAHCMRALEDARIHKRMCAMGIDTSPVDPEIEYLTRSFVMKPFINKALALVSVMNSGNKQALIDLAFPHLSTHTQEYLHKVLKFVEKGFDSYGTKKFSAVEKLAPKLASMLGLFEKSVNRREAADHDPNSKSKGEKAKADETLQRSEDKIEERLEWNPEIATLFDGWARMEIINPPRPVYFSSYARRRWKNAEEGVNIRQIERICTDKRVFGEKRKYRGGTVLIDQSGSMRLHDHDIQRIIALAPMSQIAIYGGHDFKSYGTLSILVKDGMSVKRFEKMRNHGENRVDGVALEWLARQKRPLIWVSDGMATDKGARFSLTTSTICQNFIHKHRIYQSVDVEGAGHLMKAIQKGYLKD